MIQVLGLREFYSEKQKRNIKSEVWFERGIRATTVEDIFSDPKSILAKIEPSERFNVYYTVADCLEEKGRKLSVQHHIPFDVDKLGLDDGPVDGDKIILLARVACDAIGVPFEKAGVLFSGNGVQIIVGTTKPITDVAYFDQARAQYGAVCDRIDIALAKAGLKGEADRSVWSPARLMRMPETLNRKPGKPERQTRILNGTIERIDYDLSERSGLPTVNVRDQVAESVVRAFPTPDVKAILDPADGCKVLTWSQTHPEKMTEPEWYAAVSVTARFPNGRAFTHKMSEGHPGYSYHETEIKIDQALSASGPRTCKNFNAITGGKCENFKCKHWGTKLVSPLLIEGPDNIKTQGQGFHNFFVNPDGSIKKGRPNYEDLVKFFAKEHKYKTIAEARTVWIYNGTHYEEMTKDHILQYALEHFDPAPTKAIREEFFDVLRLQKSALEGPDWFQASVEGKVNFLNGVYDVRTGEMLPHSTSFGFRSVIPCEYSPNAVAPRFMQFMDEVTLKDDSLIAILQEYMGYVFANGAPKYQKMLLLSGEGANGKSTFVDVIKELAGESGYSSLSIKAMQGEQNRAMMEGKLVNISEENSRDSFRDVELLKNMTSGGEVQVKRVYAPPYQYRNRTKLIALCNEMPLPQDVSPGFFRRLLIIPFNAVFSDAAGNKDSGINEKLHTELPGILNWAMEGYRRLEKNKHFSASKASDAVLDRFKRNADNILSWSVDRGIEFNPDPTQFISSQELYDDYKSYCDQNREHPKAAYKIYEYLERLAKQHGKEMLRRKSTTKPRIAQLNHIKMLENPF